MKKNTQLKLSFSNAVHKIVNPNYNKPNSERKAVKFSNEEKIAMFDKIVSMDNEISNRISTSKFRKRQLRRKYEKMLAEGKQPKQKTTLAQWIKMQQENVVLTGTTGKETLELAASIVKA